MGTIVSFVPINFIIFTKSMRFSNEFAKKDSQAIPNLPKVIGPTIPSSVKPLLI